MLLDGLDEAADPALRAEVLEVVRSAVEAWPKTRIVVTSRPIDTEPLAGMGFERATVEPFDLDAVQVFLGRWVTALHGVPEHSQLAPSEERYLAELSAAITGQPRIRQMAANPVMLTCLCVVHWSEGRLPDGKARVYRAVIAWLIRAREEQRAAQGYSENFALKAFATLALAMMGPGERDAKRSTLDLAAAAAAVDVVVHREWPQLVAEDRGHKARAWLRVEALWSGVIEEVGQKQASLLAPDLPGVPGGSEARLAAGR